MELQSNLTGLNTKKVAKKGSQNNLKYLKNLLLFIECIAYCDMSS